MPEQTQAAEQPQAIPDPQKLLPQGGLSNRHKRWIFFGVMAVIVLILLANIVGGDQTASSKAPVNRTPSALQQNPTPAQMRDWENNLKQTEAQLREATSQQTQALQQARQLAQSGAQQGPMTAEDLQRASALSNAPGSIPGSQQWYGNPSASGTQPPSSKSQEQADREALAYKSLFSDSVVRRDQTDPATLTPRTNSPLTDSSSERVTTESTPEQSSKSPEHPRKALDFNPASQPNYWLPEGTIIEAVLTNRLDGEQPGPVNAMVTTDVYLPGTRLLLVPQGARVLGEASKVESFGQSRLAVSFHRILVPGLHEYSIPLDRNIPGLGQEGETGLHDKVNSHYASIFGASLAIGAIGGLAQLGNGTSGFGYDPSVQFRNGVSQSMAQSSERVLDRFLNRMPTITIREGTRVKILLTDDLQLPAYEAGTKGGL